MKTFLVVASNAPNSIVLQDGNKFFLREVDKPDKPMPWDGDPQMMIAALVTKWGFWPVNDPPTINDDQFAILDLVEQEDGSKVLQLDEIVPYVKVGAPPSPPPMTKD